MKFNVLRLCWLMQNKQNLKLLMEVSNAPEMRCEGTAKPIISQTDSGGINHFFSVAKRCSAIVFKDRILTFNSNPMSNTKEFI